MNRGNFFRRAGKEKTAVVIAATALVLVASVSTIAWWQSDKPEKEMETEMEGFSEEFVMDEPKEPEVPETPVQTAAPEPTVAQLPETSVPETEPEVQEVAGKDAVAVNLVFAADSVLTWPLQGEVIVEYSPDSTIYFQTLKQYQTSEGIAVSTEIDTPVAAATAGVVSKVGFEDEIGSFVEMDLGNGYSLIYGQLKDISVTEGQYVEAGQNFAKINQPTRYYQVEGANLYLQMKTPDGTADPLDYLR